MFYVFVSASFSPIKRCKSGTSGSYDVLPKVEPFENDQKYKWKSAIDIRDSIIAIQNKLLTFYGEEYDGPKPPAITVNT